MPLVHSAIQLVVHSDVPSGRHMQWSAPALWQKRTNISVSSLVVPTSPYYSYRWQEHPTGIYHFVAVWRGRCLLSNMYTCSVEWLISNCFRDKGAGGVLPILSPHSHTFFVFQMAMFLLSSCYLATAGAPTNVCFCRGRRHCRYEE